MHALIIRVPEEALQFVSLNQDKNGGSDAKGMCSR